MALGNDHLPSFVLVSSEGIGGVDKEIDPPVNSSNEGMAIMGSQGSRTNKFKFRARSRLQ